MPSTHHCSTLTAASPSRFPFGTLLPPYFYLPPFFYSIADDTCIRINHTNDADRRQLFYFWILVPFLWCTMRDALVYVPHYITAFLFVPICLWIVIVRTRIDWLLAVQCGCSVSVCESVWEEKVPTREKGETAHAKATAAQAQPHSLNTH